MHGIESLVLDWHNTVPTIHLFNSIMFNKFFNNQVVRHGYSDCAQYIIANVKDGTAVVRYTNGSTYKYTNVSRRALVNLIVNDNISLGRWINDALLYCNSKCAKYGNSYVYRFSASDLCWSDVATGELLYAEQAV